MNQINIDQLIFDLVVVGFLIAFNFILIKPGNTIIDALSINNSLIFVFAIQYFVMIETGRIYAKYFEKKRSNLVSGLLKATVLLVAVFLYLAIPTYLIRFNLIPNWYIKSFFIGGIFFILTGALTGYYSEKKSLIETISISTITILVPLIIILSFQIAYYKNFIIAILFFLISIFISGFIAIKAPYWFQNKTKMKLNTNLVFTLRAFLAAIVALALLLWQSVHILSQVQFSNTEIGQIDNSYLIFSMILTGIVPFRLFWAFAPPKKAVNIVIAIFILSLDIYAVLKI